MISKDDAAKKREWIELAALELAPDERLWFEVHRARHARRSGRWKAVVCRPEDAKAVLARGGGDGAVFELDYPSQLAEWLEALGVRPVQVVPDDWNDLVFFGCDVEVRDPESSTLQPNPKRQKG